MAFSRETNFGFYFLFGLCTYFIWKDINFFAELSVEKLLQNATNKATGAVPTIKLRMQDHFGQYIFLPICDWLESTFKISQIPGVTPNVITFIHFICAVISGKLVSIGSLTWRRAGAILFEIRSCLDILDGVVFRAQSHAIKFLSNHGTLGWYLDSGADTLGSLFIAAGTIFLFYKHPPLKSSDKKHKLKVHDEESSMKLLSDVGSADEDDISFKKRDRFSRRSINLSIFLYALQVFIRSGLWDHFLNAYGDLLEKRIPGVSPKLQAKISCYHSTFLALWSWKIFSADAFIHYTILAIFFDKTWVWIRFVLFFGPPCLAIHCLICQLHVMQVRVWLGV